MSNIYAKALNRNKENVPMNNRGPYPHPRITTTTAGGLGQQQTTNGGGGSFATPSEDDFDDDDEFLMQASQQFEQKLGIGKNSCPPPPPTTAKSGEKSQYQLIGEIAILRNENQKLTKEVRVLEVPMFSLFTSILFPIQKEEIHRSKIADSKTIEARFKREIETLKSKLEFKEKDIQDLRTKVESATLHQAKRPRLSGVNEAKTEGMC
eukprot:sb/3470332/